jgi:hypothetical protein
MRDDTVRAVTRGAVLLGVLWALRRWDRFADWWDRQ